MSQMKETALEQVFSVEAAERSDPEGVQARRWPFAIMISMIESTNAWGISAANPSPNLVIAILVMAVSQQADWDSKEDHFGHA